MLEMNTMGPRVAVEEPPPPAYHTLEPRTPRPVPVEIIAETGRGVGPEPGLGMEVWDGVQVVSNVGSGTDSRTNNPGGM
jgi:hypothetical protein